MVETLRIGLLVRLSSSTYRVTTKKDGDDRDDRTEFRTGYLI